MYGEGKNSPLGQMLRSVMDMAPKGATVETVSCKGDRYWIVVKWSDGTVLEVCYPSGCGAPLPWLTHVADRLWLMLRDAQGREGGLDGVRRLQR